MLTNLPSISGRVTIEVFTPNGRTLYQSNPNTLVLEAPRLMFANLIPYPFASGTTFPQTDNARPSVSIPVAAQPSVVNTLGYMRFGYYLDGENPTTPTASALDTALVSASDRQVTKTITGVSLNEYGVDLMCEFEVVTGEEVRNYVEVGLYSVGTANTVAIQTELIDPSTNSYVSNSSVMYAHQTHAAVQANEGSTIKYSWTITMQSPA